MSCSRYEIKHDLDNQGGMGITSLAYDNNLCREVVVKKLNIKNVEVDQIPTLNEQLRREAINQANLTHNNIAKVYDYFEDNNVGHIVMEFVHGEPLSKVSELLNVNIEKSSVELALNIIYQMIDGIGFAHKNKIVHRDIKTDNIMYNSSEKNIKIIDFGLSKIKEEKNRENTVAFFGSEGYRPKELFDLYHGIRDQIEEEKRDIFSLGVTIYLILTGKFPYGRPENFSIQTPRISDYRNDISEELDELFYSMIAIEPEDRLNNLNIVLEAIRKQLKQGYSKLVKVPNFRHTTNIRDAIHGYIKLSQDELKIVNNRFFQRLRNIKQLGTSYLVYPCAVHSRFEHSLGVMHVATRIFEEIASKKNDILGWDEVEINKQRQMLRLLSLLHDIGHPPFSHVGDNLFNDNIKNHENMAAKIIKESELSQVINEIGRKNGNFNCNEIAGLIEGKYLSKYKLIKQIFSGNVIDADRMDYLLRDSYMAGVKYGTYDLEHLIRAIDIDFNYGEPILAIDYKGIHVLEEFILARHYMFNQVYYHKTRRIFDKILEKCIKNYLDEREATKLPSDINEYCQLDDHKIMSYISRHNSNYWNKMFVTRNPFKEVYGISHINSDYDRKIINEIKEKLYNSSIPKDKVIIDEHTKSPIIFKDEEGNPMLGIIGKNGGSIVIDSKSYILKNINEEINIFRVYAEKNYYKNVLDIIEEAKANVS
ncbi:protein kinase [Clostridium perfringens]|uniref:protein kinase domain-containing protein n=1 Tax=Clostridium perfringens TaxID=1502 RepID=UPI0018D6DD12|nr:protein kinase [Clostridium perfringens]MCR1962860.1 protein kinase [Clostridium perfringens]QPR51709.1 protein kinase [Clostridium perfringens]